MRPLSALPGSRRGRSVPISVRRVTYIASVWRAGCGPVAAGLPTAHQQQHQHGLHNSVLGQKPHTRLYTATHTVMQRMQASPGKALAVPVSRARVAIAACITRLLLAATSRDPLPALPAACSQISSPRVPAAVIICSESSGIHRHFPVQTVLACLTSTDLLPVDKRRNGVCGREVSGEGPSGWRGCLEHEAVCTGELIHLGWLPRPRLRIDRAAGWAAMPVQLCRGASTAFPARFLLTRACLPLICAVQGADSGRT